LLFVTPTILFIVFQPPFVPALLQGLTQGLVSRQIEALMLPVVIAEQ
jgi:hypothetical protein